MLFNVESYAFDFAHDIFVCKFDEAKHHFVDIRFGERACFERFVNVVVVETFAAGHFEIHICFDAFCAVVDCAPIAHDDAFKSPFVAQNVGEETLVVAQISAVETVVRAHDGGGLLGFDDMLECGHIDFAESALVNDRVNRHSYVFLVVGKIVLEGSADVFLLYAVHPRCAHTSCKEGIFGEVFKVSSAKRTSLDIYARAEDGGNAERLRLDCDCLAHFFNEVNVPTRRRRDCAGEASRRFGRLHNVDAFANFFTSESARAVAHAHGRNVDSVAFYRLREPVRRAGKHFHFLVESKFCKYSLVIVLVHIFLQQSVYIIVFR